VYNAVYTLSVTARYATQAYVPKSKMMTRPVSMHVRGPLADMLIDTAEFMC